MRKNTLILFVIIILGVTLQGCSSIDRQPATVEAAMVESEKNQGNPVRVYFATNREKTERKSPGEVFNYVISEKLTYGYCDVSIPPNHSLGEINTPSVLNRWNRNDSNKYMILLPPKLYSDFNEFTANLDDVNNLFIFIHGYNVGFGDAARRTAQMARDLQFEGKAVFFSWPSRNKLLRYLTDSNAANLTRPMLEQFLSDLSVRFPSKNFYIVAHSMGTNLLSETVIDLARSQSSFKDRVKGIVLAAPDIDSGYFKNYVVPALIVINAPVTVYVSNNDRALMFSDFIWGGPRAGKNIFGNEFLEIIDASKVDTDLIGHSYYGGNGDVLYDVGAFIRIPAKKANDRNWLEKKESDEGPFWFLPPNISKEKAQPNSDYEFLN